MKTASLRLPGKLAASIIVPVIALGLSMPVSAQIEEIVVTATKREENVQDVPVAVSVLSSDTIENANAVGLEGLQALIPSATFRKGNTTRNSAVIIRGLGTISFSTAAEPSVSTVVDGVVLGRSGQAFGDIYDIERLEVLRGPQGTLFGKNASAGVVNITTKRPSDSFEGYVDMQFYQDNETRLRGRVSGPLGDDVRGSLTYFNGDFDGYIRNIFTNTTTNGYDREGVRAMLEYEPTDFVSALFIFEDYEANDECCTEIEAIPSARNNGSPAQPNSTGPGDPDLDLRLIDHDLTTFTLDSTTAFSMQLDFDINDLTLTSITARRTWNNTEIREGDFTSFGGQANDPNNGFQLHDVGPQEWRQVSQELRLASPGGETFDWQVGLFYWNIDSERNFTRVADCSPVSAVAPVCNENEDFVSATAFFDTEFNNYAAFGEGTWNLNDQWGLLFGIRFTEDEVSFNHNRRNLDPLGRGGVGVRSAAQNSDFSNQTDESNTSGKVGVRWNTDSAGLFYVTYSQGYKGPAFNTFYNMGPNDTFPISAEESDALELGWKFTTDTLFLNLAVFRTEVENFQANNPDLLGGTIITRLTNAGDVITEGFEADITWQPLDNLRFGGGFAAIDATIDKFRCPLDPITGLPPAGCTERSGLDLLFAPDLKVSFYGDWTVPLNWADLIVAGNYTHMDEQRSALPGTDGTFAPESLLPSYDVFNLSAALSFADDRLRLSLIGKNLTDESYTTTFAGGTRYQIPREADRYFGIGLRASF
jgi:iron complex outermembrane receptor protein